KIPGAGIHTITPIAPLPPLKDPAGATLDGYTQPLASRNTLAIAGGDNAGLLIELDGGSAGASADGLLITGGNTTVQGLAINHFGGYGVHLTTAGNDRVYGNFLGTDATGTAARGNGIAGVYAESDGNAIGQADPANHNVI